jgi:hypothetical protein
VQDSGQHIPGRETEKLGNWKSDIIIGHPARQDSRFSEFQVFTHSRAGEKGGSERRLWGRVAVQRMASITLVVITVLPGSANYGPLAQSKTATRRPPSSLLPKQLSLSTG